MNNRLEKIVTVRINNEDYLYLKKIAKDKRVGISTLMRLWISERVVQKNFK